MLAQVRKTTNGFCSGRSRSLGSAGRDAYYDAYRPLSTMIVFIPLNNQSSSKFDAFVNNTHQNVKQQGIEIEPPEISSDGGQYHVSLSVPGQPMKKGAIRVVREALFASHFLPCEMNGGSKDPISIPLKRELKTFFNAKGSRKFLSVMMIRVMGRALELSIGRLARRSGQVDLTVEFIDIV
jgi:hypothetical protein